MRLLTISKRMKSLTSLKRSLRMLMMIKARIKDLMKVSNFLVSEQKKQRD
jgi:hypothetical protein